MGDLNVLVTGANGFVGRAVCSRLAADDFFVRRSQRTGMPSRGLAVVGNIDASTDWAEALEGVNVVVHLAARAHVMRDNAGDPLEAFRRVNVCGTRRLAEQARAAGVGRFVFVSSIKVNGESTPPNRRFTSADPPCPNGPYALSKLEAEKALVAEAGSTEVVIIRPPLVYGPGVRANFQSMMHWVRRGVPLPLAAVDNRRSLVSVSNLADLIARCVSHPNAVGQTFLVSDDEDVSTPELIGRLARMMGRRARLFAVPTRLLRVGAALSGRTAEFERLCGTLRIDLEPTRTSLDWSPPLSVDEGLRETVRHFLAKPSA